MIDLNQQCFHFLWEGTPIAMGQPLPKIDRNDSISRSQSTFPLPTVLAGPISSIVKPSGLNFPTTSPGTGRPPNQSIQEARLHLFAIEWSTYLRCLLEKPIKVDFES